MKKFLYLILLCSIVLTTSGNLFAMDADNWVSDEIVFSNHALERMEERAITEKKIKRVLRTGFRSWDLDEKGSIRFTERKNKIDPVIVVLNRDSVPNVVITVFRGNETEPKKKPKLNPKQVAALRDQKFKKQRR